MIRPLFQLSSKACIIHIVECVDVLYKRYYRDGKDDLFALHSFPQFNVGGRANLLIKLIELHIIFY